jgi:hypothetical protein
MGVGTSSCTRANGEGGDQTVAEPETMDRGGRSKSFNHKITEYSLFVWIFILWMGSSKNKIQICIILLSRNH